MIRGMHYMCWFPEDWNYHPSLPMKRLQQVEEIVDVRATILLWSCLGSGAIGLQYLEREAYEPIPPRLRFYGYLNDSEFCQACAERGITPFAVVWKAQMWDFPAELNADETALLALNKLRGTGTPARLGMRELSTDQYPQLFPSVRRYFPEGLRDSDGEPVTDFLEAFRVQTLDGQPVYSSWLMVPGHDHACVLPCGSNPGFALYQQKQVELMIDAGAGGVMVDEIDMHLFAMHNGGCFCRDCIKSFRAYLQQHPDHETAALDLNSFDYRAYLKERGYTDHHLLATQSVNRDAIPLYRRFVEFNLAQMEATLAETLAYAKAYARRTRGIELPVAANLFNCLPHTSSLRQYCDLIIGERSGIGLRQEGFYRFGYAFFGGKPGLFIEDPGPHVLRIVEDLKAGHTDTYTLMMLEPLSQGFNIAIPYGAWLMNFVRDSFYPNLAVERQMGAWLETHAELFEPDPVAELAVLYDCRSALDVELFHGGYLERNSAGFNRFHEVTQGLCEQHVLFNVLYVSEQEPLTAERLQPYKRLLLPDVYSLSNDELTVIERWQAAGGAALALGHVHERLAPLHQLFVKPAALLAWAKAEPQLVEVLPTEHTRSVGIGLHRTSTGYVLHLVNYRLDEIGRRIVPIPQLRCRLAFTATEVRATSFPEVGTTVSLQGDTLVISELPIYTVIELVNAGGPTHRG